MINKLQRINLTGREAEVYIALLQKKEFTAPELAKITTITRTKIYDILQSLINKGACNESYKDGYKVYRGIDPHIALQNIIGFYERDYDQKKQAMVEQMKQATVSLEQELNQIYSNNKHKIDELDYIEILKDSNEIRNKFLTIQGSAVKEILIFSKAPYSITPEENIKKDEKEILSKKKISYRSIYEYKDIKTEDEKRDFIKLLEATSKLGEKIKITRKLPIKLAIIDTTTTLLAMNDPISMVPSITTMIVNHPDFALAQKEVFESFWCKSISIDDFKKTKIK